MIIAPVSIEQDGPGIDLTDTGAGYSLTMADPVTDFEYARNAVTLTYAFSGALNMRLTFEAMEFGDEPHAPPASPFGDGENFDGVALSVDGVDWYEIQELRSLRSDRFTAYDLDLVGIAAGLGLTLGNATRIRFCQYDNNPAPKDGIFLQKIAVTGDAGPLLHLTMDDNAASPTVADASGAGNDQTFLDPGGNPNTDAHSVPGMVGTALAFDGVDDQIDLGADVDGALGAGQDFALAFWWARGAGNDEDFKRIYLKQADNGIVQALNAFDGANQNTEFIIARTQTPDDRSTLTVTGVGYDWNHYVFQRRGIDVEVWVNGVLDQSDSTAGNDRDFAGTGSFLIGGIGSQRAAGTMDDFRVYARALFASEIAELAGV